MESKDYYNMINHDKTYLNEPLLQQIIIHIDPERFDLKILNDVFKSFLSGKPKLIKDIKESDFKDLISENQYKSKVLFSYDERTWTGTVIRHKWYNNEDEKEWFTYSIKLPNDGYFYNQSYCDKSSKGEYLKQDSYHKLQDIFDYMYQFFGKNEFKTRVFYLTKRNRINIKAMCPKLCVWLQITFENGYPKEEVTEWYDQDKLKQILQQKQK
jgi:hypothetical protein